MIPSVSQYSASAYKVAPSTSQQQELPCALLVGSERGSQHNNAGQRTALAGPAGRPQAD